MPDETVFYPGAGFPETGGPLVRELLDKAARLSWGRLPLSTSPRTAQSPVFTETPGILSSLSKNGDLFTAGLRQRPGFFHAMALRNVRSRYLSAVSYRLWPIFSASAPEACTWILTGADTLALFCVICAAAGAPAVSPPDNPEF